MQLIQVVKYLEQIAISSPYIRSTGEGSVYTIMNGNPHSKYGVFVISQNQHYRDEYFDHFNFNLFVIDRLIDDLDSNRLQVQSIAKECLTNILLTFKEKFYGVTYNTIRFNVFTEKFVDLCAGAYAQVEIIIPANLICSDDYGIEFDKDYTLKPLVVEITENGVYEYEPDNFDGYDKVTVTVNVDIPDNYESGFTSGVTYQKSLLSAITITENGKYITDENGVSAITVDVSGYTQDDLDDAYQSGITYQKSLLSAITIDHNGEFINENGYSAITVTVPSTGESVNNQSKIVEISGNGSYTITYDEGYTGLESVIINVNVSGDTPTPPTPSGDTDAWYQSGFTDGFESGKTYSNGRLNITFESENMEGLINEAGVKITYSGISTTIYYTGNTISVSIMAGVDYTITYLPVDNYLTPNSYSFTSKYRENKNISCFYKYQDPTLNYENMYLTIEALSDGTLYWKAQNNPSYTKTIQYSTDGGNTWTNVTSSTQQVSGSGYVSQDSGTVITTVQAGDKVLFKGSNSSYSDGDYGTSFLSDANISVYGNIMSLLYGDNFVNQTSIIDDNAFSGLFSHCTGLTDASNLILPATTLTNRCYQHLFADCINLKYAPSVLPATTLVVGCYMSMFWGCTRLTITPALPATTLANDCYRTMFYDCEYLNTAPVLPATTLVERCYMDMFYFCRSLHYIKCLATDLSAPDCTDGWVVSVPSSGTFVKAQGVTWPTGSSGIPSTWDVIEDN